MPERLWKFVEEWRAKGVDISDNEADDIYRYCIRKMEVAKVESPDEYIDLLYPDEVRNYLFRLSINATTMLRKFRKEVGEDVFNMYASSVPSTVS